MFDKKGDGVIDFEELNAVGKKGSLIRVAEIRFLLEYGEFLCMQYVCMYVCM